MGRLVILSGPSCVGKSPLKAALKRLHPELAQRLQPVVLCNDRRPRPGERDGIDYHFRPRAEIEKLRGDNNFAVAEVRGDLQALDLRELRLLVAAGDAFFEGNCYAACAMIEQARTWNVEMMTAFMSPLSSEEIRSVAGDMQAFIADVMRRKLLRRTRKHKGDLSLPDLEDIERRATNAFDEMKQAWRFQRIIVNHDGEDSENWDAFYYPLGDARKALVTFVDMLEGRKNPNVERWSREILCSNLPRASRCLSLFPQSNQRFTDRNPGPLPGI